MDEILFYLRDFFRNLLPYRPVYQADVDRGEGSSAGRQAEPKSEDRGGDINHTEENKMSIKDETINEIIRIEGGYVNNPNDSGGATMYGITERKARKWGYEGHMSKLPRSLAVQIYEVDFWYKLRLDEIENLSEVLAEEIADTAVNMGNSRAIKFLQQALNAFNKRGKYYEDLTVDGMIGRKSISALTSYFRVRGQAGEVVLNRALNSLQGAFYINLAERRPKDEDFTYGWFDHRVKIGGHNG